MSESEWKILLITVRNDIISSHLLFMNGVSMRISKPILSC